jgi:CBS domain-containing protein
MRVRELLSRKPSSVITVEPSTEVGAVARLLLEHGIGGVPVVSETGAILGFVAERDIVQAVNDQQNSVRHLRADAVMRRPAPTCTADDAVHDVMVRMTRQRLRHLVVEDQGKTLGVISVGDLVKHRLEQLETETGVLRDYVAAQRAVR